MTLREHQRRVDSLQRRADARKGMPGYQALLQRLRDAQTAKLAAELKEGIHG